MTYTVSSGTLNPSIPYLAFCTFFISFYMLFRHFCSGGSISLDLTRGLLCTKYRLCILVKLVIQRQTAKHYTAVAPVRVNSPLAGDLAGAMTRSKEQRREGKNKVDSFIQSHKGKEVLVFYRWISKKGSTDGLEVVLQFSYRSVQKRTKG